jgi:hypothetical protein
MNVVAKALTYNAEWKRFSLRKNNLEGEDLSESVLDQHIAEQFDAFSIPILEEKTKGYRPSLG